MTLRSAFTEAFATFSACESMLVEASMSKGMSDGKVTSGIKKGK